MRPRARPTLDQYRHIALLPRPLMRGEVLDADGWITWADVAELSAEVLGADHVVTGMPRVAAARCAPIGPWHNVPTYDEVVAICQRDLDGVEVGIELGREWLRFAPVEQLRGRRSPWKVRPRSPARLRKCAWGSEFLLLRRA